MTAYDINLLLFGLVAAFAIISFIAFLLSEGAFSTAVLLSAIAGGFYYFAGRSNGGEVFFEDIAPAISKLMSYFIG